MLTTEIEISNYRKPDHDIEPILFRRWSPRAMSGEEISEQELMTLFEAARWAPSSYNARGDQRRNRIGPISASRQLFLTRRPPL